MRILIIIAATIAGYLAGAFGGGWLVSVASSNTHDRSMEAAMTGAFVLGPLGAVIALIAAIVMTRKATAPDDQRCQGR
jgi:cation transporter-like permease